MAKALQSKRGQGRINAMRFMCELETQKQEDVDQAMRQHFSYFKVKRGVAEYAKKLIRNALLHQDQIDETIQENSENWDLDRMGVVDRNVLRLAIGEMELAEAPPKVIINEMVEVAKIYGSVDSASLINGILDTTFKNFKSFSASETNETEADEE